MADDQSQNNATPGGLPEANSGVATRVAATVERLLQPSAIDVPTKDKWASALDIPDGADRETRVMLAMVCFRQEVARLFSQLEAGGLAVPYGPVRVGLEAISSGAQMPHGWSGVKQNVRDGHLPLLQVAAISLKRTEVSLSAEQLAKLGEEARNYASALPDLGFSDALRRSLERAVSNFLDALQLYPILGAKAIEDANEQFFGVITLYRKELDPAGENAEKTASGFAKTTQFLANVYAAVEFSRNFKDNAEFVMDGARKLAESESLALFLGWVGAQ